MKIASSIWIAALLCAGSVLAQDVTRRPYIVQLTDLPAANYNGAVAGYPSTRPPAGQKLDMRAASVQAYLGYLANRQSAVLVEVGNAPVYKRFGVAFNGFAAHLTDAEAAKLRGSADVVAVTPDEPRQLETTRTPAFLGLTTPGGLLTNGITGEDVVIGMIDGGIAQEHPAFSDKVDGAGRPVGSHLPGTVVYGPLPAGSFTGTCQTGPGFPATACNQKLVGARAFRAGFNAAGRTLRADEFDSPRDADGHGSHTASTAAGNVGVMATINGQSMGLISGMAPRARIAAYKVCWLSNQAALASCFVSDNVSAIDQAVADGVDVINYSISGTRTDYLDPVEVAFIFAADAGVFVAASAGNDGPANTVAHISPWITTVAASTHDRLMAATVTLGNGAVYSGPSAQTAGQPSLPLILATDAGVQPFATLSALQQAALRLCFNATDLADGSLLGSPAGPAAALDPAKVAGRIVVCDRGSNARVNKGQAVLAAGGAGMVLLNTAANTLNDDLHFVPTVHLSHLDGPAVRTYAALAAPTASFSPAALAPLVAPVMADFSSRGPNQVDSGILKPDITAPGVAIIAAYAPVGADAGQIALGNYPPPAFNALQGTSMASPHVAGMAALVRQAHPTWSPAAIKSALLTTTTGVKLANGAPDPNRFAYGAGHANPNAAAAAGLVYDAGFPDYAAFLCGRGLLNPTGSTCNTFGFLPSWQLNLPSLSAEVVGRQVLQRKVTNVGTLAATYVANATIPGFNLTVSPSSLTLAPGAQGSFSVFAQRTTAPMNAWAFGDLTWDNGQQTLRSPVTLKAVQLAAPAAIADTRVRGNKVFTVATGYDGTLRANTVGLVPATRTAGTVTFGRQSCHSVVVPAGAERLRLALYNADTTGNGADDLDLIVFRSGFELGESNGATSSETVELISPTAGSYDVCVVGLGTSRGGALSSAYALSSWIVAPGFGIANSLRVSTPSTVVTGGTGTVAFLWSVTAGQRYFTTVQYTDGTNRIGQTSVLLEY